MSAVDDNNPDFNRYICSNCRQPLKLADIQKIEVMPVSNHVLITRSCPCFDTLPLAGGQPRTTARTMFRWNLIALNLLFDGKPFNLPWEPSHEVPVDIEKELTEWKWLVETSSDSEDFLAQFSAWSVHDDRVREEFRKKWGT